MRAQVVTQDATTSAKLMVLQRGLACLALILFASCGQSEGGSADKPNWSTWDTSISDGATGTKPKAKPCKKAEDCKKGEICVEVPEGIEVDFDEEGDDEGDDDDKGKKASGDDNPFANFEGGKGEAQPGGGDGKGPGDNAKEGKGGGSGDDQGKGDDDEGDDDGGDDDDSKAKVKRVCAPSGKPECQPKTEVCNGKDDDCDGLADNHEPCSDGNACNGVELCDAGQCLAAKPLTCDDGSWCTADGCDPLTGCTHSPAPNGVTCDDGDACTGCGLPGGILKRWQVQAAANCPEGPWVGCNALWMPGFFDGKDNHVVRFDLEPGAQMIWLVDGSATLKGTAKVYNLGDGPGVQGQLWDVLFSMSYRGQGAAGEGTGGPKLDVGWTVPKAVSDQWRYFDITAGKLTQVGGEAWVDLTQRPKGSVYPFQVGIGANNKTMAFSSSAWLDWVKHDGAIITQGHGDINVDLLDDDPPAGCDLCMAGQCSPGTGKGCEDDNPCTVDACAQGKCLHQDASGGPCDDGQSCTKKDVCVQGQCKSGKPDDASCDDQNPCTSDGCLGKEGCLHTVLGDGSGCDDGSKCTVGDGCNGGKCVWLSKLECDDGNPCSNDTCDPKKGCQHNDFTPMPCDDGDACTAASTCHAGACIADSQLDCDDQSACTQDSCDAKKGCQHLVLDTTCDDGNACTQGDVCQGGKCKSGNFLDCNDGLVCTTDSCDWQQGCLHALQENGSPCDDGTACTQGEACAGKQCKGGKAVDCDDQNACTQDGCSPLAGCTHVALSAVPCDDGDKCTATETCAGGKCQGAQAVVCDDANPCTADWCNPQSGCINKKQDGKLCDDGNACTGGDACKAGLCQSGPAVSCDDDNLCTADACLPKSGCVHNNIEQKPCDDGNSCTTGEACAGGTCQGGAQPSCDDGNPCTTDVCDKDQGCLNKPSSGKPCDDGDVCTTQDSCAGGVCQGQTPLQCTDNNPCTIDTCAPGGGCVFKAADGKPCDDGNACTLADACAGGACTASKPQVCDDKNPCTADGCSPLTGCTVKNLDGSPCDDGDACTVGDACKAGGCQAGAGSVCNDNNPCTVDSCDLKAGCTHQPQNGKGCDDGDACTTGDLCQGGACAGNAGVKCDDGNDCTSDFCDAKKGCWYPANDGLWCDDGSVCTTDQICKGGACVGTKLLQCDDGNPCTADLCDPQGGCVHGPAEGKGCDDGDACTAGDACVGGACQGGPATGCDDGDPCTGDSCDKAAGCQHQALSGLAGGTEIVSDAATLANGAPSVPTWDKHPSWTASIPGATWVWSTYWVAQPTLDTSVVFTRSFQIPAAATSLSGQLVVAADNSYVCTVNGQLIGQDPSEYNYFESGKDTWALGTSLQPGANLLACTVKNWAQWYGNDKSNPAGLLYKLTVSWQTPATCDDGDACTQGDACVAGQCKSGPAKDCGDGNPCTTEACDPKTGACTSQIGGGGACNDGNACTGGCLPSGVLKQWQPSKAVTDPKVGWAGGGHALHIPGFYDGNTGHTVRMTLDDDARFDLLTGGQQGHLHGTATVFTTGGAGGGSVGDKWAVDVWFQYRGKGPAGQGAGGPKHELNDGYQPKKLTDTWLYFDMIPGKAKLTRVGNSANWAALTQAPAGSMYPFQIGVGANGKNLHMGASSWFFYTHHVGSSVWSAQGDFNLDFTWLDPKGSCDQCTGGQCQGPQVDCNDHNPFTIDSCDPAAGCKHVATSTCMGG